MPLINIYPQAAKALAELQRDSDANPNDPFKSGLRFGFTEGLRSILRSEEVGFTIMQADLINEGLEESEALDPRTPEPGAGQ